MAAATSENLTGTWFRTGFYGHARSRPRSDCDYEFRHAVKPRPPVKFEQNMKASTAWHLFSRHDNKYIFLQRGVYSAQGVGRRSIRTTPAAIDHDMFSWGPKVDPNERFRTSYHLNFNDETPLKASDTLSVNSHRLSGRRSAPPVLYKPPEPDSHSKFRSCYMKSYRWNKPVSLGSSVQTSSCPTPTELQNRPNSIPNSPPPDTSNPDTQV